MNFLKKKSVISIYSAKQKSWFCRFCLLWVESTGLIVVKFNLKTPIRCALLSWRAYLKQLKQSRHMATLQMSWTFPFKKIIVIFYDKTVPDRFAYLNLAKKFVPTKKNHQDVPLPTTLSLNPLMTSSRAHTSVRTVREWGVLKEAVVRYLFSSSYAAHISTCQPATSSFLPWQSIPLRQHGVCARRTCVCVCVCSVVH